MSAGRALIRDAELVETFGQVFNLVNAGVQVVEFRVFVKTNRKRLHVAAVHAAIGQIALEGDGETAGAVGPVLMARGEKAAHIDNGVFLGRHGHAVGQREHLAHNLLDTLVGIALLAHLYEIGILGKTG